MKRTLLLVAVLGGCFIEPDRPGSGMMQPPGQAHLSAGSRFACAIRDGGTLACWGQDASGQLGVLPTQDRIASPQSALGAGWTAIVTGDSFACGLAGTTLKCWGSIATLTQAPPTVVTLPGGAVPAKIFGAEGAMCALDTAGDVYCYGTMFGTDYSNPTKLDIAGVAGPWTQIAIAYDHACALNQSGAAYCWGDMGFFLGGPDDKTPHTVDNAQQVVGFTFDSIAASQGATCGVTTTHQAACGGAAVYRTGGPVGDGPVAMIDARTTWQQIAIGSSFACGIVDGGVECYGFGVGVDGDGFASHPDLGLSVYDHATGVVAGYGFACATDGTDVKCWGSNEFGEMGNGKLAETFGPTDPVPLLPGTYTNILTGAGRTCVLVDGVPYCWGVNNDGQSLPAGIDVVTPVKALNMQVASLAGGDEHTCGMAADGSQLHCWGAGDAVELDLPGTKDIAPPSSTMWTSIAASDVTTCATATDNNVYCLGALPWMANDASTPTVTMSPIIGDAVAAGAGNVASITRGQASITYVGKLCDLPRQTSGMSVTAPQTMFTDIKGSADTSGFGVSSGHICALDASAGALWCLGSNTSAQVSSSGNDCEPTPVKVPLTQVTSFSLASRHSCAISGGGLYCWGQNEGGELGTAAVGGPLDSPQRIDTTMWREVSVGSRDVCGINMNGKVYCWGLNVYGEVGVGEHFHPTPTPVQF